MLRSVGSKVAWVGRTASMVFGLALVMALVLGVATTALSATGANFILGKGNTATTPTSLVSTLADAAKSAFVVRNKSGGPALDLRVGNAATPANSVAPMKVNSSARVANLNAATAGRADSAASADTATNANNAQNADKLDDKDSTEFLGTSQKAADSDKLDDLNSTDFQRSNAAAGGDLSGTYPNPQLANGAVRGGPEGEIEDESITSHDINEHGVTSMDILNDTIESGDIAPGGVGSAEVVNGGLDVADVAEFQYNFTVDPPVINAHSCYTGSETLSTVDSGDLVIVNAADDLPPGLVMFPLTPSSNNPQFKYRMCNITSSAIDPASGGVWRLAIFDDGNDN